MGHPIRSDQVGHRYQRRSPYFSCGQAASHSDRLRPEIAGPIVGRLLGMLDGTHRIDEIKTVVRSSPREAQAVLSRLVESLHQYECLRSSSEASIGRRWFDVVHDRDTVHSWACSPLYRQRDNAFLLIPGSSRGLRNRPSRRSGPRSSPNPRHLFLRTTTTITSIREHCCIFRKTRQWSYLPQEPSSLVL